MVQILALLMSVSFIACAHANSTADSQQSGTQTREAAATSGASNTEASATAEAGPTETVECRTPNVADSGYRVQMTTASAETFRGTIAGVAIWGTEKPTYEGEFKLDVAPHGNNCQAHFKTSAGASITAQNTLASAGKAGAAGTKGNLLKSSMVLKSGGATEPLVCTVPPSVLARLQKCQAGLAQK